MRRTVIITSFRVAIILALLALSLGNIGTAKAGSVNSGSVWVWGENNFGQLGLGNNNYDYYWPQAITFSDHVTGVAAGLFHSLAVEDTGSVWAWGYNGYGQLGNHSTSDSLTPILLTTISDVKAVSAGTYFSLALKNDGTVWAWGDNSYGQLGNGTSIASSVPIQVNVLANIIAISAGAGHALALKNDGTVWAWGWNKCGQIGDGAPTNQCELGGQNANDNNRTTPQQVAGLSNITAISAGGLHNLVLKNDGTAMGWGYNTHGAVGDGSYRHRSTPVDVKLTSSSKLTNITMLSAGSYNSIALCGDGTVWVWGENSWGQDGIAVDPNNPNINTDQYFPFKMPGLDGLSIKAVAAGNLNNFAITSSGTIYGWGLNRWGELGRGEFSDGPNPLPQPVVILSNAITIAGNSGVLSIVPGNRPRWDVNGDHVTDIGDIAAVGMHWLETGTPGWIAEDVNLDGVIDIGDVAIIGFHWQETW